MKKKRRSKSKPKPQNSSVKNMILKTLIGSAVSMVVFVVLALIAAFILWKNDADVPSFKYIISVLGAVAGLVGGFVAVRPVRKNGIAFGALSALLPCAVIITAAVLIAKTSLSLAGWIFVAVYIVFSAVGGIIAVNKRR